MSGSNGISVKAAVLYGLAIIVVAFIGVVLGNWFVEWRQQRDAPPMPTLETWQASNGSLLVAGDAFPAEELLDMDSNVVNSDSLIGGKTTMILFLSPGCGPCATAVEFWKNAMETLPPDLSLISIAIGDFEEAKAYRAEHEIPFPVYCDAYMLYTQQYEIVAFPTLVGVNDAGQVALVWHGYNDRYRMIDYYNVVKEYSPDSTNH